MDPGDSDVREFCRDVTVDEANERLGVEDGGLDYYIAAVRELFEETGVLLADPSDLDEDLDSIRNSLNEGSLGWAEFVRRDQQSPAAGT